MMRGSAEKMYNRVGLYGEIEQANPHKLISMLYEGALKRIVMAKKELALKNVAEKGVLLGQAMMIVANLKSSLNMEQGGDISIHLTDLYDYIETLLLKANFNNDAEMLDEVMNLLLEIKGAWDQIA
ncbi:MAG: flagellar export chaperone FliS [Gammaproteobacteria bacterium]|nr:flagellar export chaperone FliS [Gammaproteobacteria bacterium]